MLTDPGKLKDWADPALSSVRDTALVRCIEAASSYINALRQVEQTDYTEHLSGSDAYGRINEYLDLPSAHTPVRWPSVPPATFLVFENAEPLEVATGYSASADVLLRSANVRGRCTLVRNGVGWYKGYENITVVYQAGYAADAIPVEIEQLANELALFFFRSPDGIGKSSQAQVGTSASWEKSLSEPAQVLLNRLRDGVW